VYRRKPTGKKRVLWDGRYKPHYIMLDLEDFIDNTEIEEAELYLRWIYFIDIFE
jgi:hypothetical protein